MSKLTSAYVDDAGRPRLRESIVAFFDILGFSHIAWRADPEPHLFDSSPERVNRGNSLTAIRMVSEVTLRPRIGVGFRCRAKTKTLTLTRRRSRSWRKVILRFEVPREVSDPIANPTTLRVPIAAPVGSASARRTVALIPVG
jgi:hypothetical protein